MESLIVILAIIISGACYIITSAKANKLEILFRLNKDIQRKLLASNKILNNNDINLANKLQELEANHLKMNKELSDLRMLKQYPKR